MALFGRRSARQRLRSAARESLTIPAFSAPVDCSAWVLGGLWPAELATVTPETTQLADYLNADLQRIANSANEKLYAIGRSDLVGQARRTAEARVINVARAFAVLRVESTVRQLHKEAVEFRAEYRSVNPAPPAVELTGQSPTNREPARRVEPPRAGPPQRSRRARHRMPEPVVVDHADDEPPTTAMPAAPPDAPEDLTAVIPAAPERDSARAAQRPTPAPVGESADQRLHRLLAFVARQEPGLRWAVGTFPNGKTLLVTDLASGWIPSGIELPAGVQLLEPDRRTGMASAMLGDAITSATYHPGDRLGWAGDFGTTDTSVQPRELPAVEDLGRQLSEATRCRDGLPRMANTLAQAGASGSGVADAEIDLLRVDLDTARYQLLAQYPDADDAMVLNCMLLAASEGIAAGDEVSANYHYSWFRALSRDRPS